MKSLRHLTLALSFVLTGLSASAFAATQEANATKELKALPEFQRATVAPIACARECPARGSHT